MQRLCHPAHFFSFVVSQNSFNSIKIANLKSQIPSFLLFTLSNTPTQNYTTVLLISQDTLQSSNAANLIELHASLLVVQDVHSTWPKVRKGNPPGSTNNRSILFSNYMSTTSIIQHWVMSQVFQPYSVLRYLPKICSRISQICLCISASKSLRWSRNIAMMSRWFALRRTSSSKGKSHSKRTSKICIIRKTLVTLSNPIIQPMYRSSIASRNGRLSRLSILSTDRMAILSLSLNATVPTRIQWFSQLSHSKDF